MTHAKRQPSRQQIFAAVAAFVGSIYIMALPKYHDPAWFYLAAAIGTIALTFLLSLWLRPSQMPPQVG